VSLQRKIICQLAPMLSIANLNNKNPLALPGYTSLWDSAESFLRLTYRREEIIDHSSISCFHQWYYRRASHVDRSADARLKGYCPERESRKQVFMGGFVLILCVGAVNVDCE